MTDKSQLPLMCPGVRNLQLDMPGYRCRGGGVVVVMVEVTSAGGVRNVSLQGAKVSEASDNLNQFVLV